MTTNPSVDKSSKTRESRRVKSRRTKQDTDKLSRQDPATVNPTVEKKGGSEDKPAGTRNTKDAAKSDTTHSRASHPSHRTGADKTKPPEVTQTTRRRKRHQPRTSGEGSGTGSPQSGKGGRRR